MIFKKQVLFLPFLSVIVSQIVLAQNSAHKAFSPLESRIFDTQIEIQKNLAKSIADGAPNAAQDLRLARECRSWALADRLSDSKDLYSWNLRAKESFSQCQRDWSQSRPVSQVLAFMKGRRIQYAYSLNPRFKEYVFETPEGLKIRFILGLRPGSGAWPLVVVKCGILCNLDSATLARAAMHLYDEGPFHVALVASSTGDNFVKDNKIFSIGGVEEGRQLHLLAEYLFKSSSFKTRFSSLHLLSHSLGSSAGLFSGIYNTSNDGVIKSILATCPVVDLEASFKKVFEKKNLISYFIYKSFADMFHERSSSTPSIRDYFERWNFQKIVFSNLPNFVSGLALEFYQKFSRLPQWRLRPFESQKFKSVNELYEAHRFQNHAERSQTQTLLWAAQHDAVVNTEVNVSRFEQQRPNLVNRPGSDFHTLVTPLGGHCDFNEYYGWNIEGTLLRSYFELQSPELANRKKTVTLPIEELKKRSWWQRRISRFDPLVGIRFEFKKGSSDILFVQSIQLSTSYDQSQRGVQLRRLAETKFYISGQKLLKALGLKIPSSDIEADIYTRFLNANSEVLIGKEDKYEPKFIRIHYYPGAF